MTSVLTAEGIARLAKRQRWGVGLVLIPIEGHSTEAEDLSGSQKGVLVTAHRSVV